MTMTADDEASSLRKLLTEERTKTKSLMDLAELAWGIIANANGGDWTTASKDWQDAAARWRESYHAQLAAHTHGTTKL